MESSSIMYTTIVTLMAMSVFVSAVSISCKHPGDSNQDEQWMRDPSDCATVYLCLLGRSVVYTCPKGFVIGAGVTDCVKVGSELDDCK